MQAVGTGGLKGCITPLALIIVLAAGPLSSCTGASPPGVDKPSAKVDPELLALYEAYREAQQRGTDVPVKTSRLRVHDDRIVIDATSSGDAQALQADLVGLGMRNAAVFGTVVSGELPIAAIPRLVTLAGLTFARPAVAQGRPRGQPGQLRP